MARHEITRTELDDQAALLRLALASGRNLPHSVSSAIRKCGKAIEELLTELEIADMPSVEFDAWGLIKRLDASPIKRPRPRKSRAGKPATKRRAR